LSLIGQIGQWFLSMGNVAVGFLLGSIITGVFTWKVVIPKIMENKDVKQLKVDIQEGKKLFEEALPILKSALEELKNNKKNS
jgi:uncharacterized membrane protein (DUF106 family)